jgi:hypothetical protein
MKGTIAHDTTLDDADLTGYFLAPMKRLLFVMFLLACGGGTDGVTISNLVYTPQSTPAGTDTIFDMTFDFDSQADVTTIEFELLNSPAGPSKTPQDFPVNGAAGVRHGSIDAKIDVTFQTPGTYEFGLDVLDANHQASNQVTGVITVQ